MATSYRRVRQLLLAGLSLALAVSAAGCELINIFQVGGDSGYTFALENYTDRPLEVSFTGRADSVRPCSVHQCQFLGPRYGTPVVLEVRDDKGASVLSLDVIAASEQAERPIYLQIGGPEGSSCPAPQEGYVLVVENGWNEDFEVRKDGTVLGSVPVGGHARFGPFPGHWKDMAGWSWRESDGREYPIAATSVDVDYDLGETPEVEFHPQW